MRSFLALLVLALPAVAAPVPKGVKAKPVLSPDGGWRLVQFSSDGAVPAPPKNMVLDWHIGGEHITNGSVFEPAHHAKGEPNFLVRNPDRPNERLWGPNPAVYEVDGDTLRCCYAHDGRKELSECKPAPGIHYYVFERVNPDK